MMRIATTILALVICPTPLFAATIYPDKSDPICDFRLEGPIELGDAEVLERMIRPSVNGVVLCLNSPPTSTAKRVSD